MDAFYASVEQRDNPSLRGKPVIVGGHAQRGVVLAASLRGAPLRRAQRDAHGSRAEAGAARDRRSARASPPTPRPASRCSPSSSATRRWSSRSRSTRPSSTSPPRWGCSARPRRSPGASASEIAAELSLPASAGIAAVKFVAKIASDLAKPNGQREVPPGRRRAFLAPLPVSRLWGVGPKTEEALTRAGLKTIGDVAARDVEWLEQRLGVARARTCGSCPSGIDDRARWCRTASAKSVGAEDTFEEDLAGLELLRPHVHAQALRVGRRLRKAGVQGAGGAAQGEVRRLHPPHPAHHPRARRPTTDRRSTGTRWSCWSARTRARPCGSPACRCRSWTRRGGTAGALRRATAPPEALNRALDRIAERFGARRGHPRGRALARGRRAARRARAPRGRVAARPGR